METSSGTGATLLESVAKRMGTRLECTKDVVSPTKRFSSRQCSTDISPDTPCGNWPLGRIIEVCLGKDKHVRVANVQVGKTVFKRPITRLCPLEINEKE